MPNRYLSLAFLSTLCGGAAYFGRGCWFFDAFAANMAAGFLASLLTVVMIDRAIERRANADRVRVLRVAVLQMNQPLSHLVQLFADMIKAAQPSAPRTSPSTVTDLFAERYTAELDWLDLSSNAPVVGGGDWIDLIEESFMPAINEISGIVDRFVSFLEARHVEAFENLRSDGFVVLISKFPAFRRQLRASNTPAIVTLNGTQMLRKNFFTTLLTLIAQYQDAGGEELGVPPSFVRDDMHPVRGTSRCASLQPPIKLGVPAPAKPGDDPYAHS